MSENNTNNTEWQSYRFPTLDLIRDKSWLQILNSFQPVNAKLPILWSFHNNTPVIKDLAAYSSLLVIGPPAIGKTTFLNQLIFSLLLKNIQHK